jgi:hypothetical protein
MEQIHRAMGEISRSVHVDDGAGPGEMGGPGRNVVRCAPWQIPAETLDSEAVQGVAANLTNRVPGPRSENSDEQQSMFSDS